MTPFQWGLSPRLTAYLRVAVGFFILCYVLQAGRQTASAAPLGRATASFDNARPGKAETAWGRLVADSLRSKAGADVGLVDAGSLNDGTLNAGDVSRDDIEALLAFGTRDNVVVLTVTGSQLRAVLERAVQDYPTRSASFLHGSGLSVRFRTGGTPRIQSVQVGGRDLGDNDRVRVAAPSSMANGAIFGSIWDGANRATLPGTLTDGVADYIRAQKTISPDPQTRIAPG